MIKESKHNFICVNGRTILAFFSDQFCTNIHTVIQCVTFM